MTENILPFHVLMEQVLSQLKEKGYMDISEVEALLGEQMAKINFTSAWQFSRNRCAAFLYHQP